MIVNARTVDEVLDRLSVPFARVDCVIDEGVAVAARELISQLWDRVKELEGVTDETSTLLGGRAIGLRARSQAGGLRP